MSKIPTVIDLFAGVGGLSLGAARAGFEIVAAVENDPIALSSHALNFPNCKHYSFNLRRLTGEKLLTKLGLGPGDIDGIIGGPPVSGVQQYRKEKGKR